MQRLEYTKMAEQAFVLGVKLGDHEQMDII